MTLVPTFQGPGHASFRTLWCRACHSSRGTHCCQPQSDGTMKLAETERRDPDQEGSVQSGSKMGFCCMLA